MIIIEIDGGLVQNVYVRGDSTGYVVVDRDVEGCDDDEVFKFRGREAFDPGRIQPTKKATAKDVAAILKKIEEE